MRDDPRLVSPGWFETVGPEVLQGGTLTDADRVDVPTGQRGASAVREPAWDGAGQACSSLAASVTARP